MAVLAGQVQWRGTLTVACVDVGPVAAEQGHQRRVTMERRNVEGSEAIHTTAVHAQTTGLQAHKLLEANTDTHTHNKTDKGTNIKLAGQLCRNITKLNKISIHHSFSTTSKALCEDCCLFAHCTSERGSVSMFVRVWSLQ